MQSKGVRSPACWEEVEVLMPDLATLTNFLFEITFPVSLLCPSDYWAWGAITEGHLWMTKDLNLNRNARIWLHNFGQVSLTSQSLNAPSVNHPGYVWERKCRALWTHTWMNMRHSTDGRPLWQLCKIRATGNLTTRKWWSWDLHVPIQLHLLLTRPLCCLLTGSTASAPPDQSLRTVNSQHCGWWTFFPSSSILTYC